MMTSCTMNKIRTLFKSVFGINKGEGVKIKGKSVKCINIYLTHQGRKDKLMFQSSYL